MTGREIAIAIRERCRAIGKTPKRIFHEAGVNPRNYPAWRCQGVKMPSPERVNAVFATLERYEHAQ